MYVYIYTHAYLHVYAPKATAFISNGLCFLFLEVATFKLVPFCVVRVLDTIAGFAHQVKALCLTSCVWATWVAVVDLPWDVLEDFVVRIGPGLCSL